MATCICGRGLAEGQRRFLSASRACRMVFHTTQRAQTAAVNQYWACSSISTLKQKQGTEKQLVRWKVPTLQRRRSRRERISSNVFPFDLAWDVDSQSLASNLFATSIIPYAGFLYHLQKSKKAPGLMLFGFYFLLVFVAATIIAGIYAKLHYNTILANVDWLHGSAESFLTLTNLFIVIGLRRGIKEAQQAKRQQAEASSSALQEQEASSK